MTMTERGVWMTSVLCAFNVSYPYLRNKHILKMKRLPYFGHIPHQFTAQSDT